MPAYNFQKQFVPLIIGGQKPHTIRKRRKHPTKVGDHLVFYTGMRTRYCRWFAEARCIGVEPIVLKPFEKTIICFTDFDIENLAVNDGFTSWDEFFEFFCETYRAEVLEDFEIIRWDPKALNCDPKVALKELEVRNAS
jgi:hypothetical protein